MLITGGLGQFDSSIVARALVVFSGVPYFTCLEWHNHIQVWKGMLDVQRKLRRSPRDLWNARL